MRHIGIFGTSGMAREAGDIAVSLGLKPLYIARDQNDFANSRHPENTILESEIYSYSELPCVIAIGENATRRKVVARYGESLRFTNLIHPSATFGYEQRELVEDCKGIIVAAGARFTNGIEVGDFSIFNQNATIGHDCIIEDYVHVASNASISGNVCLKKGCWIGAGAVVNQGENDRKRVVGEGTVIGSGAVVVKDCEPNTVYVGVPARRLK